MANFNFNKIMIGGRLTVDPEYKKTEAGISFTCFSVAVNRRRGQEKGKDDLPDFFNVVAWRSTADFVAKYFKKGSSVFVCGELHNRSWAGDDGEIKHTTEIIAQEVSFVDSKGEAQNNTDDRISGKDASQPNFTIADVVLPF